MENSRIPLLFSGSSQIPLAQEVAAELNISLGSISLDKFPDGETSIEILEDVLNRTVFVLQSTVLDTNNYLIELLLIVDALKRSGAKTICAIIPYFGYSRQDRKDRCGVPISAKLVANMLSAAGITHLITFDLHSSQLEGFFEIPVIHLHCQKLLGDEALKLLEKEFTIVVPDIGSIKIVKKLSQLVNINFVVIEKQRLSSKEVKMNLIGNLSTKSILIVDDICSTAGTLIAAASLCRNLGVEQIVVAVTHAICCGDALQKIESSPIQSLIVTNSVPPFNRFSNSSKIHIVSIAPMIAEAIKSICNF